ncbi:hypothetical protein D3C80_312630 [compost metagenome]
MAADNDVDIRDFGDVGEVTRITDMSKRDNLGHALCLHRLYGFGDLGDIVGNGDVRTRICDFRRVVGHGTNDTDLLATDFENDMGLDAVTDLGSCGSNDVCGHDRELDLVEECGENIVRIVEFVVADGHRVELHRVQDFGFDSALVGRVEQRALEVVAGIEQQNILVVGLQRIARLVDRGQQSGCTAEALALALFFSRAGGIVLVDGFDTGVKIVDVQDVEFIVGKRHTTRQGHDRCGQ